MKDREDNQLKNRGGSTSFRKCNHCGMEAHDEKSLELFEAHPNGKYGRANKCKQCASKISLQRQKHLRKGGEKFEQHQAYIKNKMLQKTYNITLDRYNEMYSQQEGKCAICSRHSDEFVKGLCVDHCHVTGKVRGLLCGSCNTALGSFTDNTNTMQKAIDYIVNEGVDYE